MRKLTIILFTLLFFATTSFAQLIKEGNRVCSAGSHNSLSIELRKTEAKDVEKAFAKYIDQYKGKTKLDKKAGEILSDNAVIKEMGNNDMDIYARVADKGENSILTVWFDLGGAFLSSERHPAEYKVAEKIIMEFAINVSKGFLEDQLKDEEKTLKKLEADQKKLLKDKEDFEKDIEKAKALIAQRENDIRSNIDDQKNKQVEISTQQTVVEKLEAKIKSLN